MGRGIRGRGSIPGMRFICYSCEMERRGKMGMVPDMLSFLYSCAHYVASC